MSSRERRGAQLLLCAVLVGRFPTMSEARTTVALDATVKAASNPLLQPGRDLGAALFELSVMPEYKQADSHGNTIDLAAIVTVRQYSRLYPRYLLGSALATREFRGSEHVSGKVSLGVARDLAADTPAVGIDALVSPRSVRTTLTGAADITWRLDDRTTVTPSLSALRSTYDHNILLRETSSTQASIGYTRAVARTTTVGVKPVFALSKTSGQPTLTRYAVYGTIEQRLSPVLLLEFDLGAEHVPGVSGTASDRPPRSATTAPAGSARLCGKTVRLEACLSGTLGSQVSALDGFQRSKVVSTTVRYRLDERKTIMVQLDYQRVAALPGGGVRGDLEAGAASVTFDWRVASRAIVSGVAGYGMRQSDARNRPSSTFVGLRLRIEPRAR